MKNLMSILRQNGCPSIFLTLSCAEFDWPELVKEIAETVYRKKFTDEQINQLSDQEKNKLISENVVQSTVHFQKRIEKMFSLMSTSFFGDGNKMFHASDYFFRVEFQQRGAPHIHSLLWLQDQKNEEAPSFWMDLESTSDDEETNIESKKKRNQERVRNIEKFADLLISTSSDDIKCEKHIVSEKHFDCSECKGLKVNMQVKNFLSSQCELRKKCLS